MFKWTDGKREITMEIQDNDTVFVSMEDEFGGKSGEFFPEEMLDELHLWIAQGRH